MTAVGKKLKALGFKKIPGTEPGFHMYELTPAKLQQFDENFKPQAPSSKPQATSRKQQALDKSKQQDYIGYMKVKELINKLTEFDMNAEITISDKKFMKGNREAKGEEFLENGITEKDTEYEVLDIFSIDSEEVDILIEEIK